MAAEQADPPLLQLRAHFDPPDDGVPGTLRVRVISARNLPSASQASEAAARAEGSPSKKATQQTPKKRSGPAPDPYLKLYLSEHDRDVRTTKQKSKHQRATCNPQFNEKFIFYIPAALPLDEHTRLQISVWDNAGRLGSNACLGSVSFSMMDVASTAELTGWFYLLPEHQGRRMLSRAPVPVEEEDGSDDRPMRRSGSTQSLFANAQQLRKLQGGGGMRGGAGGGSGGRLDTRSYGGSGDNLSRRSLAVSPLADRRRGFPSDVLATPPSRRAGLAAERNRSDGGSEGSASPMARSMSMQSMDRFDASPQPLRAARSSVGSQGAASDVSSAATSSTLAGSLTETASGGGSAASLVDDDDPELLAKLEAAKQRRLEAKEKLGHVQAEIERVRCEIMEVDDENETLAERLERSEEATSKLKHVEQVQQQVDKLKQLIRMAREENERITKMDRLRKDELSRQVRSFKASVESSSESDAAQENERLKQDLDLLRTELMGRGHPGLASLIQENHALREYVERLTTQLAELDSQALERATVPGSPPAME
eukprot:m.11882 g.11882  ORF g.11882 m.11882 type:complete len:542 (+) comp4135_c0_seq1:225-1850(+)